VPSGADSWRSSCGFLRIPLRGKPMSGLYDER
jgi:hypothetical protein